MDCQKCVNPVTTLDGTSCLYCQKMTHITCLGLTEFYGSKALAKPEIHHICSVCTPIVKTLITLDNINKMRIASPTPQANTTITPLVLPTLPSLKLTHTPLQTANLPPVSQNPSLLSPKATSLIPNAISLASNPSPLASPVLPFQLTATKSSTQSLLSIPPPPLSPSLLGAAALPLTSRNFTFAKSFSPVNQPTPFNSSNSLQYISPVLNRALYKPFSSNLDGAVLKNKMDSISRNIHVGDSDLNNMYNSRLKNFGQGAISKTKNTTTNKTKYKSLDILLVGDSLTRFQSENLTYATGKNVLGVCLPGAGIEYVSNTLKNNQELHKGVIVQVGTNDIGKLNETDIKYKYIKLLNNMKNRRGGSILIGILPRGCPEEKSWNQDAKYINKWLEQECGNRGINFVDMWENYWGDWSMYTKDAVHQSRKGKMVIVNKIQELIKSKCFLA